MGKQLKNLVNRIIRFTLLFILISTYFIGVMWIVLNLFTNNTMHTPFITPLQTCLGLGFITTSLIQVTKHK